MFNPLRLFTRIGNEVGENPFLSGGMILMAVNTVMNWLRGVINNLVSYIERQFFVTANIISIDPVFWWLQVWLDQQPMMKKVKDISISSVNHHGSYLPGLVIDARFGEEIEEKRETDGFVFSPAPGNHFLWYKGKPLWLSRARESDDKSGFKETIELKMFGKSTSVFRELILEAKKMAVPPDIKKVHIYTTRYGNWDELTTYRPRSLSSVILPDGVLEEIIGYIKEFMDNEQWYVDRGTPYRLGIQFDGVPGTGKSSAIIAIATHFNIPLYLLNLSKVSDAADLSGLLYRVKKNSIVLIEDIDTIVDERENVEGKLSFGDFLNDIDGPGASESRILVITTNHPEKLDEALIRKGRIDRKWTFTYANIDQLERIFMHFYNGDMTPEELEPLAIRFAEKFDGQAVTMADAQEILKRWKHDPLGVIENFYGSWN